MTYLIYNPLANNNQGEDLKNEALANLKDQFSEIEVVNGYDLDIENFVNTVKPTDEIILVGGDGTLNRFVNFVYGKGFLNKFYLYRAGTGNDFINDVSHNNEKLIPLNDYIKKMPYVLVNNEKRYFVNGVGLGVDGLVCKIVNELKGKKKKINYTWVAVKTLLGKYKRTIAEVIVDGVHKFKCSNVWFVASMVGKFFGGGMKITPDQDRLSGQITMCLFHCRSKIKTLYMFSKIFDGKHVKYTKNVHFVKGKRIEVKFENPSVMQIDGETVEGVTSYIAEIA